MPDQNADLKVRPGESAAAYKARIDETRRDLQRQAASSAAAPAPASTPDAPPSATSAQGSTPAAPGKTSGDPASSAGGQNPPTESKPEVSEWMKWCQSKGFVRKDGTVDMERMTASQRELERELHRKIQEERTKTPPLPTALPPAYPPGYVPPPPAWTPPPAPPRATVEAMAKEFDMDPTDFDRVARVASAMTETALQRVNRETVAPLTREVSRLHRELSKQNELLDLMGDPSFRNPQVQFHMDRIMRDDPSIIEKDPAPWTTAYHKALNVIAREHLGGTQTVPAVTPTPDSAAGNPPPGMPPKTAGQNGGGSGAPRGTAAAQIDPVLFAKMSLDEKRAHLQSVGAL